MVKRILMLIYQIVEELFPFGHYYAYKRRQEQRIRSLKIENDEKFKPYLTLDEKRLRKRLKEEHERAARMDEKTFKFTLPLSLGLTLLTSAATLLADTVSVLEVRIGLITIIGISLLYFLAAGFVALGALRTLPSYGYGTEFFLQQKNDTQVILAEALACQELMNISRHQRNETTYIALRNGFSLVLLGAVIFVTMLLHQLFSSQPCS